MPQAPHEPTPALRKQVETLAAYGVSRRGYRPRCRNYPADALQYYPDELDTGDVKANAKVAQNLFRIATSETPQAVTAAIFWMKARAGWR